MGTDTLIQWTNHTFNPWYGCTQISSACDHCYAKVWGEERFHRVVWNGPPRRSSAGKWREPYRWNRAAQGCRASVFCLSLGDFFDNQVPPDWRADLWRLIGECRQLDWLILTKRPQNIAKMLPDGWPWPHVMLGVTVENQAEAARRLPILTRIPAAGRFVSAEPLLEAINLRPWLGPDRVGWVIVGGESGKQHRLFDPEWASILLHQCREAGAAFFMKQLGGYPDHRSEIADFPAALRVREWPASVRSTSSGS